MTDNAEVDGAFVRLRERLASPRALVLRPEVRVRVEAALERARAQLLGGPQPVLTIAIAGGTGAGKSTLINALAGATIAESGAQRPTTTRIRVYHHADIDAGALPADLGADADFVAHRRPELRTKVLVDTPDLDSFVTDHRKTTARLLKRAGLVLYVFSPEKYLEERTWSVLREERCFSASAAVLNKSDRLSPDEQRRVVGDLGQRFAGVGLADIRVFGIAAQLHLAGSGEDVDDDFAELRSFIEEELRDADVVRMVVRQRQRTLDHLRRELDAVVPPDLSECLDRIAGGAAERWDAVGRQLGDVLQPQLARIEADLAPIARLRQHERFWGPFRTWLAIADFARIGLSSLLHRLLGQKTLDATDVAQRLLSAAAPSAVADVVAQETRAIQDQLHQNQLPVARWHAISTAFRPQELLRDLAGQIQRGFEDRMAGIRGHGRAVVWGASAIGTLVPAVMVFGGLYVLVRDLVAGEYGGMALLGHVIAIIVLFFAALQGVVAVLMGRSTGAGRGLGRAAVGVISTDVFLRWLQVYRDDLEADAADLRAPLDELVGRHADSIGVDDGEPESAALPQPVSEAAREATVELDPEPPVPAPEPSRMAAAERFRRAVERHADP